MENEFFAKLHLLLDEVLLKRIECCDVLKAQVSYISFSVPFLKPTHEFLEY